MNLNEPIKVVIPLVEHEDIRRRPIQSKQTGLFRPSYHDIESCLYINPKGVTSTSVLVLNHFGKALCSFLEMIKMIFLFS